MVISVSVLPPSEKTKGLRPLNPEVYRFCFQKGSKKAAPVEDAAFPQTLCAAQVAPQRCPILRIGKVLLL
jgi:hypothetical protein